ncbi:actin-like protein 6A, partial [Aphis craccivora]
EFGSERFKIPEQLFDPSPNMGGSMLSISHIVVTSAGMCDVDVRPTLYNNIVITGGNSLIQGFPERLNRDLTARVHANMRLKIISPNGSSERRFGAWIGGSIIASTGAFQQMWYSRHQYNEGDLYKSSVNDSFLLNNMSYIKNSFLIKEKTCYRGTELQFSKLNF